MTNRTSLRPLSALFFSLACQLAAFGLDAVIFKSGLPLPPWALLLLHSSAAFGCACFLGLSRPWQFFNLLLVPLVSLSATAALPSWVWAAIAVFLLLIYLPAFWTRVPYYPTPTSMYDLVAEVLPRDREFTFVDLGCGFSGMIAYLAALRPKGRFYGIEIGPLPFFLSCLRACFSRNRNLEVSFRNFWKESLSRYDFVYAFLAPPPMKALWAKVQKEMKPGGLFITNTFAVDAKADDTKEIVDGRTYTLYFHKR